MEDGNEAVGEGADRHTPGGVWSPSKWFRHGRLGFGSFGETPDRAGPDRIGTLPKGWLYTFGQPRVGNGAWMLWFDGRLKGRSFRVVHSADIVARVPWLLRMFRHAGTEVFYDAAGTMHVEMPWYRKMTSDALGLWQEWQRGRVALLADHHVDSYVKLVGGEQWTVERSHGSAGASPSRVSP